MPLKEVEQKSEDSMSNHHLNEELGEIICPKCKGRGSKSTGKYSATICNKCWGKGKLDWVEQCMGVKPPDQHTHGTSSFGYACSSAFPQQYVGQCYAGTSGVGIQPYQASCMQYLETIAEKETSKLIRSYNNTLEQNEKKGYSKSI